MISDDQLTLYFYGDELSAGDRREIERALASDAALASRYQVLCAELDALTQAAMTSRPTEALTASLHDALTNVASAPAARSSVWPALALAASVCLVALLAIFALRGPTPGEAPRAVTVPADAPQPTQTDSPEVIVTQSVQSHLVASRLQLVRFEAATSDERNDLLLELMARNRVAAERANAGGNAELARVLRAMQLLLVALSETANGGGDLDPALLQQIDFELNAMLTKLGAPASDSTISF